MRDKFIYAFVAFMKNMEKKSEVHMFSQFYTIFPYIPKPLRNQQKNIK